MVAEDYGGEFGTSYYAVAVVRKNNTGFDINSLEGKKSCHTGANKTAGWNIPVGFLLAKKLMKMDKSCCPFTSVANFFANSCVPGKRNLSGYVVHDKRKRVLSDKPLIKRTKINALSNSGREKSVEQTPFKVVELKVISSSLSYENLAKVQQLQKLACDPTWRSMRYVA